MNRICVFCGSNNGRKQGYRDAAWSLGTELARRGIGLVYGGGRLGLMGAVADAVLASGGEAIGVIPEALFTREVGHDALTSLHVVGTMHERKALMAELSDAFITLPGGFGTMEEFFEVLTWAQLGMHHKACALLNTEGYFDPLLALFDSFIGEQFAREAHRDFIIASDNIPELFNRLETYRPPALPQWIATDDV